MLKSFKMKIVVMLIFAYFVASIAIQYGHMSIKSAYLLALGVIIAMIVVTSPAFQRWDRERVARNQRLHQIQKDAEARRKGEMAAEQEYNDEAGYGIIRRSGSRRRRKKGKGGYDIVGI
jgi:membrane protein implicated in regulation of membrane protease activity